ncbi:FtsK/SpoIIIE domain-containing protein [Clavibacter tessellarius]|uniref:FtsK/SpoIIIE domain-containing protein n=1 Tax=Clavibacter tessellarius TaxID=31965 RepID=UPI0039EA57C1
MDIAPPPSPPPAPPPPFPVLGVAAPLVVSVAVWAVTRSPYALLFAALGPVVAVAGVADQRISGRRTRRRAARERAVALLRLREEVAARLCAARRSLLARAPSARDILDGRANPALLWRAQPGPDGPAPPLVVGSGAVPSGLVWRGEAHAALPAGPLPGARGRAPACLVARLRGSGIRPVGRSAPADPVRWAEHVRWIPDAPVLASSAGGLGLRGPAALVAPVLRGAIVQLVHALPPDDLRIDRRPPGAEWAWLDRLPHSSRDAPGVPIPAPVPAPAPARRDPDGVAVAVHLTLRGRPVVLAAASRVESLPAACRTVLDLRGPGTALLLAVDAAAEVGTGHPAGPPAPAPEAAVAAQAGAGAPAPDGDEPAAASAAVVRAGLVRPELVSLSEASRFAEELAALARRRGLDSARAPLPARVPFAEVATAVGAAASDFPASGLPATDFTVAGPAAAFPASSRPPSGLAAAVGVGHDGPVVVDLVADGPHAVVAGTTGSGKSELLVTWMAALAAAHPPEDVTVLLVDFKGGAAFDPLLVLPHAVGLVTDLDGNGARRALESLRAEIRHRERTLREAGARDVDDPRAAGVLPRLVIVVDELAALLADQDGLHEVVSDIAARGRSLGMHLVLCTQRPAGVVRDAVLANCDLRLSLRVNNEADSRALLGVPDAAHLPAVPVGRCLLGAHGGPARPFQVAVTTADDLARIAAERMPRRPVRRPWLDPLPAAVPLAALAGLPPLGSAPSASPSASPPASPSASPSADDDRAVALPFALVDLPAEQRRAVATWRPATDGHLLVLGGPGSGRSSCLGALAASAGAGGVRVRRIPSDPEGCWDAFADVVARIRRPGPRLAPLVVLADDLDVAVSRLGPDHQAALLDLVAALVREGPHAGVALAASGRRPGGALQAVGAAAGPPVVLALPTRQEHVLAGGESALFDPSAAPGAGEWRGMRIQVALPPAGPSSGDGPSSRDGADVPTASASASADPAPPLALGVGPVHALVASAPAEATARLRAEGVDAVELLDLPLGWSADQRDTAPGIRAPADAPRVVVGDPDAWLVRGALLADIRRVGSVVLEGCAARDVRTLLRVRQVPPPLAPVPGRVWLVTPDGAVERRSWRRAPAPEAPEPPGPPARPEPPAAPASAPADAAVSR